jgi:hypothetical protein
MSTSLSVRGAGRADSHTELHGRALRACPERSEGRRLECASPEGFIASFRACPERSEGTRAVAARSGARGDYRATRARRPGGAAAGGAVRSRGAPRHDAGSLRRKWSAVRGRRSARGSRDAGETQSLTAPKRVTPPWLQPDSWGTASTELLARIRWRWGVVTVSCK